MFGIARRKATERLLPLLLAPAVTACPAPAAALEELGQLSFVGTIHEAQDISAVTRLDRLLLIASDEDGRIQFLDPTSDERVWRARVSSIFPLGGEGAEEEIDLEGLARWENGVYALGSHSLRRRLLQPKDTRAENRRRLANVEATPSRDHLFRLTLDPATGELGAPIESINLREFLRSDEILGPFSRVPGKENGIEIEGIAALGQRLFLGFRSPVLRSGDVPVMVLAFDQPQRYELRFVDLGGLGIRDLARVQGGLLVLAGFEGPGGDLFRLFYWDGNDRLLGRDQPPGTLSPLGDIPAPAGGKAEGVAVLEETPESYRVLIVYDGVKGGAPRLFRVPKGLGR